MRLVAISNARMTIVISRFFRRLVNERCVVQRLFCVFGCRCDGCSGKRTRGELSLAEKVESKLRVGGYFGENRAMPLRSVKASLWGLYKYSLSHVQAFLPVWNILDKRFRSSDKKRLPEKADASNE